MSVLAIDQGTTSTGAMVLNESGHASMANVFSHRQIYPQPGWVEHNPEELIANVQACVDANADAAAIGIDNQGESCLAWNAETGEAVSPVIVWQDNRTQSGIDSLKSDGIEPVVLEKTGLPLDSYFSASKLAWIIENIPEAKTLSAKGRLRLGTTDAFFLDRLTGQFVTDITTASRTSLMDLETGRWDQELCNIFRVPVEALPAITPTTGDFGTIRTGDKHIPVTASVVDQQASLYGHGCRGDGDAKVTFGTGAFALTVTGETIFRAPDKGLLPTVAWHKDGQKPVYALDGGVYCASSAVNWAQTLGLFSDFTEINGFEQPPAIERNLAFVPALTGLACPHWDRSAAGLWIGLSLDTTRQDMMQAILEGVAFRAAEVLDAMAEFVPLGDAISIDGGMTANPYFCQFLSDILDRPVSVPKMAELTALGTALLAGSDSGTAPVETGENTVAIFRPQRNMAGSHSRFAEAVNRSKTWS